MGNLHPSRSHASSSSPSPSTITIVLANGKLQELHCSLPASQVVAQNPNFFVCHSSSLRVGKRPSPLHPDTQLQLGHLYFLLPMRVFQSRLAWSHICILASKASVRRRSSSTARIRPRSRGTAKVLPSSQPFHVVHEQGHTLRITTTLHYLEKLREEGILESVPQVNVCDSPQVLARYIDQLIARSNSWRPRLDTIQEAISNVP